MRDPGVHPVIPAKPAQVEKSPSATMDNTATDESPEKEQERMLMQKYGNLKHGPTGGPKFLQKRMQPQRKFFDSGDYNLEKQQQKKKVLPPHLAGLAREPPVLNVVVDDDTSPTSPTSPTKEVESDELSALEIPKPNTVPHRKSSIFEPGVNSKLSPQPLLHMPPAGDMHLSVDD